MRCAFTAAALIKENDAIDLWIEILAMFLFNTRSGASMGKKDGFSFRIAALFKIESVYRIDGKESCRIGLEGRIKSFH